MNINYKGNQFLLNSDRRVCDVIECFRFIYIFRGITQDEENFNLLILWKFELFVFKLPWWSVAAVEKKKPKMFAQQMRLDSTRIFSDLYICTIESILIQQNATFS